MGRIRFSLLPCLTVLLVGTIASGQDRLGYNRDIRPILSENCFPCHGPDSAAREADLRLDQRDGAIADRGGYFTIVPGNPDESELIFRVESEDELDMMPPPSSHKKLTPEQKDLLRRWVTEGAEYEPHWSFIPPTRPEAPAVSNECWVRNPIDRYIMARLDQAGLTPAPEADRRTLIRRVSLDLTGLPPSPEDVEAFVNDPAPDAYERLVERLLRSPAWGEHRARYWLDAARYADTHGYHFDNYREMWSYRDWVIDAYNRNMPFDQFLTEQLAGDLLPNATLDQKIASGFNRCNMTTNEGGTIPEENLVLYTKDRTETVSTVFLGLTANCATCHDHKYDPLSQREFYEMSAFFNNSTQGALDGNIKDTPPILFVPKDEDRSRWTALQNELSRTQAEIQERRNAARPEFDQWLEAQSVDSIVASLPSDALQIQARLGDRLGGGVSPSGPTGPALELATAGDFERDQPFSVSIWVKPSTDRAGGAIVARMDDQHDHRGWDLWLENNRVGMHLVNRWPDNAFKVTTDSPLPVNQWTHVTLSYDGSGKPGGVRVFYNGEAQKLAVRTDALKQDTVRTEVPFKIGQRHSSSKVEDLTVSDLRIYGRALDPTEVVTLASVSRALDLRIRPADQRPAEELDLAYGWWLNTHDPESQRLAERRSALEQEEQAIRGRGTIAHVMQEKNEPAMAFVLFRGEYDKRRDQVQADTPKVFPPLPEGSPRNRLGFAHWLLRPDHPLTARVTVNRFWQEVFGTGLVRTAGDFGIAGELPSHPELLDWLAVEFRESGWNIQAMYRLMVTSATYRQSAVASPEKREADLENRLLARGPRFRLDAEVIRDYALACSDLLSREIGGPSVRPYQPEGVWEAVAMPESNTKSYQADSGNALYRRSLYTFWKRAAPPASMEILNAPNRETCSVQRERTNTPLQALVTLNDPQFVEAARILAQDVLKASDLSREDRFQVIAMKLMGRPFRPEELSIVARSLETLLGDYASHPDEAQKLVQVGQVESDPNLEPTELAAWTMLCNQLLNLDEVLTK